MSDLPTSSHVGHDDESAQQLLVHAAGLTLTIYPSKAAKFEAKREQDRNAHLNLRFEAGIPLDARGLFAELSGALPMSEATRALLKHCRVSSCAAPRTLVARPKRTRRPVSGCSRPS